MKTYYLIGIILLFCSCTAKISPIEYGVDNCDFCKMGIVDNKHASQVVTDKGKNYKFDAIECMLSYKAENEQNQGPYLHVLVSDLVNPGNLIPAEEAVFIISKNIPSPMGAFLSATKTNQEAKKLIEQNSGEIYTYTDIVKQIKGH